jgi:ribose transport system substrate-binding protein
MQSGAAQAIRNAGKIDQVKVYASGEGSQLDCDQVNQGNFYKFLSYTAGEQGRDAFLAAVALLEGDAKPGSSHKEYYTRPIWLDKSNASGANCYAVPKPPTPTTAADATPKK